MYIGPYYTTETKVNHRGRLIPCTLKSTGLVFWIPDCGGVFGRTMYIEPGEYYEFAAVDIDWEKVVFSHEYYEDLMILSGYANRMSIKAHGGWGILALEPDIY